VSSGWSAPVNGPLAPAPDWVRHNASRYPDLPALEVAETGAVTTWTALDRTVGLLAGHLRGYSGVTAGDRVAVLAENDVRFLTLQFACMRIGAVLVPLNWRLSALELRLLCSDAAPALVCHDETWAAAARDLAAACGAGVFGWDGNGPADDLALARMIDPVPDCTDRTLDMPTHILYTSGTTGLPKGAVATGSTLAWHTLNILIVDDVRGPGDKLLACLPLFHAGGLNTITNPMLMSGGCVIIMRRFEPNAVLRALADPAMAITHFVAVPTVMQTLLDHPDFRSVRFDALRNVQVGGGTVSDEMVDAWRTKGVDLQNHYGGTEMGPVIAAVPRSSVHRKRGSCGLPVMNTRVRIVGEHGEDVPVGDVGEVWLSGPSMSASYWRRDRAADDSFAGDWLRTGDAARRDDDGFLYLVDRYKEMYKSGGENVFPAEVEAVLREHARIHDVAVIGVPDPRWGEVGLAIVVTRDGAPITRAELAEVCTGKLAKFKHPHHSVTIDELPRNALGKVSRVELRDRYGNLPTEPTSSPPGGAEDPGLLRARTRQRDR
jgi:fatty-acyl-CoA synthase